MHARLRACNACRSVHNCISRMGCETPSHNTSPLRSEFVSSDKFLTNERTTCSRVPQDRTLYSGNFTRENKSVLGVVRIRSTQTLHVLWQGSHWDATGGCPTRIIDHLALKVRETGVSHILDSMRHLMGVVPFS